MGCPVEAQIATTLRHKQQADKCESHFDSCWHTAIEQLERVCEFFSCASLDTTKDAKSQNIQLVPIGLIEFRSQIP